MEIETTAVVTGDVYCLSCGESVNYCPHCGRPLQAEIEGTTTVEVPEPEDSRDNPD
jgi:hypothetical protein